MKIQAKTLDLLEVLRSVEDAVSKRKVMPILNTVMFKSDNGQMSVFANDMEIYISKTVDCGTVEEDGVFCVDARKLIAILDKLLPIETVLELATVEGHLNVIGKKSKFRLPTANAEEFPQPPDTNVDDAVTVPITDVFGLIDIVSGALEEVVYKPIMTCVNCQVSDNCLTVVGTNGKSMVIAKKPVTGSNQLTDVNFVIPRTAFRIIRRNFADCIVSLSHASPYMCFSDGKTMIAVREYEDAYPDWQNVVTGMKSNIKDSNSAVINIQDLRQAIDIVSVTSKKAAVTPYQNYITVSSSSNEGDSDITIDCEGVCDLSINVNCELLANTTKGVTGAVRMYTIKDVMMFSSIDGSDDIFIIIMGMR